MPESRLYQNALTSLGASRARWDAAAESIEKAPCHDSANESGQQVLEMIQAEEQLSSDPANADPALMTDALQRLARETWPTNAVEFKEAYEAAVKEYRLQGQPIHLSPPTLCRYLNGPFAHGFLRCLASALEDEGLDSIAGALKSLIDAALATPPTGTWGRVIEFVRKPDVWSVLVSRAVPLALGRGMFVTFDLGTPTPRASARWLHAALALPLPPDRCFLEIRFPARAGDLLHFPTFADAGWFRHFAGAPVGEPCGWTRPHRPRAPDDPVAERQPEAVQVPPTLDRIVSPNDLRAVPP